MTAPRLTFRRHRLLTASWTVLAVPWRGGSGSAHRSACRTAQDRRLAVDLGQRDGASALLCGRRQDPGTPAQMVAWEVGASSALRVAVMALLLAVARARAA